MSVAYSKKCSEASEPDRLERNGEEASMRLGQLLWDVLRTLPLCSSDDHTKVISVCVRYTQGLI